MDDCVDYCLLQDDEPLKPKKIPVVPANIAVMPPTMVKNSFSGVSFGSEPQKKKKPSNKVAVNKEGKAIAPATVSANATKEDLHFLYGKNKTMLYVLRLFVYLKKIVF